MPGAHRNYLRRVCIRHLACVLVALVAEVYEWLQQEGMSEKRSFQRWQQIAAQFGKLKSEKKPKDAEQWDETASTSKSNSWPISAIRSGVISRVVYQTG